MGLEPTSAKHSGSIAASEWLRDRLRSRWDTPASCLGPWYLNITLVMNVVASRDSDWRNL